MIVDGAPDASIETDVCIVGGGPAGISLALELARHRDVGVCLLESGGLVFEEATQDLARAQTVGAAYYPLHETRIRALGGSSWSWGGICTPLDSMAFEARPWVDAPGWPIPQATLEPYLNRALDLCGISQESRLATDTSTAALFDGSGLDPDRVAAVPVYFSRPVRFGVAYRAELASAPNLQVRLHTTATGLESGSGAITAVEARSAGRPFRVAARHVVLAGGGIENARLLLASGLGGPAVGQYFMEHPRVVNRYRIRPGRTPLGTLVGGGAAGTLRFFRLTLPDALQRREELLNYHVNMQFGYLGQRSEQWPAVRRLVLATRPPWNESPYFQDAGGGRIRLRSQDIAVAMRRPDLSFLSGLGAVTEWPPMRRYLEIWSAIEQIPEARNRVELLPERDALGMPRVRVHWSVGEAEERTYRAALAVIMGELEKLEPGIAGASLGDPDPWPAELVGNWHHEGTTRMHDDPELGVVDRDCRVHGVANLSVTGSSVFPTSGSTSPTVTIVQLSLRLAERLAGELREPGAVSVAG